MLVKSQLTINETRVPREENCLILIKCIAICECNQPDLHPGSGVEYHAVSDNVLGL